MQYDRNKVLHMLPIAQLNKKQLPEDFSHNEVVAVKDLDVFSHGDNTIDNLIAELDTAQA